MKKKLIMTSSNVKELVKPRAIEEIYSNSKIVESLCRTRDGACRTNRDNSDVDQDLIF